MFGITELSIEEWPSMCHQLLLFIKLGFPRRNTLRPFRPRATLESKRDSFDFSRLQEFEDETPSQHGRRPVLVFRGFETGEVKDRFGKVERYDYCPTIA